MQNLYEFINNSLKIIFYLNEKKMFINKHPDFNFYY